ncbi:MAG: helix-turn-helix domain-containing protein [Candidatus Polarisedimenticolaceae bacterium]|nr:helix-turn-helix domain-containing protein [Candidatus Polarisedimenticolaceae bacterium]
MITNPSVFSERVKDARKQLGLTQEELAHELGVSFATINRWENAKTTPFKLARKQFDAFCKKMEKQKKLKLPPKDEGVAG